ncbi:MAG: DUF4968 domain-containing protein, partial [Bacteroidales bacterium]|nr:DUF4968 domain-containing protein [Bacteroidales bacterium]
MKKLTIAILFLINALFSMAQTVQRTNYGLKTTIDAVDIEVQFFSNNIVRILKSPAGSTFNKKSFSVIKTPEKVDVLIKQTDHSIEVVGKTLNLKINRQNGQICYFNKEGKQLLAEKESGVKFTPAKDPSEKSFVVNQSFLLHTDEAIYGLGQHQKGSLNQRNQKLKLKQANMQIAIPYFYSTNGYGLFWDNTSTTTFEDKTGNTSF